MYYVYMLRCEDNSIYTGITNDLERRMSEHFKQGEKCAKYTLSHRVEKLELAWKTENKVLAAKLEYRIKKELTKQQKEELIKNRKIEKYFAEQIESEKYKALSKQKIKKITCEIRKNVKKVTQI